LEILKTIAPKVSPEIAWLPPLFLDDLLKKKFLTEQPKVGRDVAWHPFTAPKSPWHADSWL